MKNELVEQNGIKTLVIGGQAAVCPFRSPFMIPGKFAGTADIIQPQCNSCCPHFRYENFTGDMKTTEVVITCGSNDQTLIIDNTPKVKSL